MKKSIAVLGSTGSIGVQSLDVAEKAGPDMSTYTRVLYSMLFELSRSYQSKCSGHLSSLYHEITHAIENTPPFIR